VPTALGIAIKVEDGDSTSRIRASVIVEVLRQLGVVTRDDGDLWSKLEEIAQPTAHNLRGLDVGAYVPVFRLQGS
jgi:L-asparaginase II